MRSLFIIQQEDARLWVAYLKDARNGPFDPIIMNGFLNFSWCEFLTTAGAVENFPQLASLLESGDDNGAQPESDEGRAAPIVQVDGEVDGNSGENVWPAINPQETVRGLSAAASSSDWRESTPTSAESSAGSLSRNGGTEQPWVNEANELPVDVGNERREQEATRRAGDNGGKFKGTLNVVFGLVSVDDVTVDQTQRG
ncbi:hypothetical protein AURDEDRAFT_161652 [Auricularia subglabra TFB-10046 SS5]|nr:hypothetical protein AURDEDRAFT_161652 [Auricularia subglabra TFB-10046 SS5]